MILKVIENLESKIKPFFLCDVKFVVDEKVIKKGKLLNVSVKDFFVIFVLEIQKGGIKTFEIPYPFKLDVNNDNALFDYTLETLVCNNVENFVKIMNFKPKKKSKFYNNVLTISKNYE